MSSDTRLHKILFECGLKSEEISSFNDHDAIQYLRYHHKKYWGVSSILFLGFSALETQSLILTAKDYEVTIKSRLSNDISFICISENSNPKRVEKANSYDSIKLTKREFQIIFNGEKYNLFDNKLLYDSLVSKEYRIGKPLSNFDYDVPVESFSYDNENTYMVNLHLMNCTCKDFEKKQRHQYLRGDIRRLCKHLMDVYKNSFGLAGLSNLNSFIIENGHPVNKNFKYFNIEKIPYPVVVNYQSKDDWWNIFMANEKGVYFRYGYHPTEKRFSYDEKPHGFVLILKQKLELLNNELSFNLSFNKTGSPGQTIISNNKGCINMILILVLIFAFILYIVF